MLTISGNARIFLSQHPVSMRKSFEGLSALVEEFFPDALFSGALFIFLNRRRDHIKILSWDVDGLVIWFRKRHFCIQLGKFKSDGPQNISHAS